MIKGKKLEAVDFFFYFVYCTLSFVFILNNFKYKTFLCLVYNIYALGCVYFQFITRLTDSTSSAPWTVDVTNSVCMRLL